MRPVRILILALVGAVAVAACSETPEVLDGAVTTFPDEDDVAELVAEVQAEIQEVSTEIENSEAAADLRAAWSELSSELNAAIASITSNQAIDTAAVRDQLDEFQSEVEMAGDEVSDELRSAWIELRSKFERLLG
jgi:ABC-type glycerol-3-phosphate transport system substrate-binding protein